jgi:hypothetical protein
MPIQPPPPARPTPPQPPQQPPVNRPQGATVGAAQTYPPGSRYNERTERTVTGPDPQESKLRSYELAATGAVDEPVVTIAQEQRARSEAMQEEGVERFKARGDDRDPNERPRSVPGVGFRPAAGEAERSTPEARAYQNKAAP